MISVWFDETPPFLLAMGEDIQAEANYREYYQVGSDRGSQ